MAKVGRFWSDEGEAEYRRVYDDARALWPEHEVRRVETRYGEVQTLTVGSGDATPIVLLHGMSCTSLMWRPNVEALAAVCETVTVTPWRSLVVPQAEAEVEVLREAGFAVEDDSPWARLSACVGAPFCRRTESPTMDLATAAAPHLPAGSRPLHVVGCDRRCGEPHVDHVTVVAPTEVADLLAAVGGPRA